MPDLMAVLNSQQGAYLAPVVGLCLLIGALAAALPLLSRSGCKEVAQHIGELRGDIKLMAASFDRMVDAMQAAQTKQTETITDMRLDLAVIATKASQDSHKRPIDPPKQWRSQP
jgi:hypothetical protein